MRYNAFESIYLSLELSLFVYICILKLVRQFFTVDKEHVFYLMPRSFHLLLVFGYHKTIHIHSDKFISWIPMIFTFFTVCYSVLDNLVLLV